MKCLFHSFSLISCEMAARVYLGRALDFIDERYSPKPKFYTRIFGLEERGMFGWVVYLLVFLVNRFHVFLAMFLN